MIKSLLRRIAYALVILWIISMATFWLSKLLPGDAVMDYISVDETAYARIENPLDQRLAYGQVATSRGLHLPNFYFSIYPALYPDSLQLILSPLEKSNVLDWMKDSDYSATTIKLHSDLVNGLEKSCRDYNTGSKGFEVCQFYARALLTNQIESIQSNALVLKEEVSRDTTITENTRRSLDDIISRIDKAKGESASQHRTLSWLPEFTWHGGQNQYHQWMKGLFLTKPLTSLIDGRNAWTKISEALKWT
ncbi:MAG: hypothetical protein M3R25_13755, partial [Bacteroidota bacterium]|nr:hypothetical protein [Bacteroidota bacterium]